MWVLFLHWRIWRYLQSTKSRWLAQSQLWKSNFHSFLELIFWQGRRIWKLLSNWMKYTSWECVNLYLDFSRSKSWNFLALSILVTRIIQQQKTPKNPSEWGNDFIKKISALIMSSTYQNLIPSFENAEYSPKLLRIGQIFPNLNNPQSGHEDTNPIGNSWSYREPEAIFENLNWTYGCWRIHLV